MRDRWSGAGLIALAATGMGVLSNMLLLLYSFLFSLPLAFYHVTNGYTQEGVRLSWGVYAVGTLLFCCATVFFLSGSVGERDAMIDAGRGLSLRRRVEREHALLSGILEAVCGILLHTAAAGVVAVMDPAYLTFAGPLPYMGRYLANSVNSISSRDAFAFSPGVWTASFALYFLALCVAAAGGWCCGFRRGTAYLLRRAEDEILMNRAHVPAEEEEAAVASSTPAPSAGTGGFLRFSAEEEAVLEKRNRRTQTVLATCILLWWGLVLLLWYGFGHNGTRTMLEPSACIFPILLILPFWPFRLYRRLFGETYYARVEKIDIIEKVDATMLSRNTQNMKKYTVVSLRTASGPLVSLSFRGVPHLPFRAGDTVFKLSAYPTPLPVPSGQT